MHTNLRGRLKRSYSVIKKSRRDKSVSTWVKDNFYCIHKHYRSLLSNSAVFKDVDFYSTLLRYCEDRDYSPTPESLAKYLSSSGKSYDYHCLTDIRELLCACAIIKLGELLAAGRDERLLPNTIKLLHSVSDPGYDKIIPELWLPEGTVAAYEPEYDKFDSETKSQYRMFIASFAASNRISEQEAAKRLISEAKSKNAPLGRLLYRPKKSYRYGWYVVASAVLLGLSVISCFTVGWITPLLLIPFGITAGAIADRIISFVMPPVRAPRLEIKNVPKDAKTLVTVTALMNGGKGDEKIFESLERFYYMNPDSNIYFCLLADLPDSDMPYMPNDNDIVNNAIARIESLNQKHGPRFCLFFRERVMNESENRYGGWERKRGAVCELITHIVHGGKREYYGGDFIRDIKYMVTLDSDTNLSVDSVKEMLSVALHPVNRPVVQDGRVAEGYGIIQPTVHTELKSAYNTAFSRLISGAGGADVYATASFVRSQNLFGSGSFCGKGLIDVELFDKFANNVLPEKLVLSHDVLEGSLLRTAAVSDITLTDSTPGNTVAYFRRHHRWLRGDFQNLYFLNSKLFDKLSKFRLLATALRQLSPLCSLIAILFGCFMEGTNGLWLFLLAFSEFLLPCALGVICFMFGKTPFACLRFFSKAYSMITASFIRLFFEISSNCRKGLLTANALCLSIYRIFSRKKTLQWTTSAQTEKLSSSLGKYVLDGALSCVAGLTMLIFSIPPFMRFTGLLYFVYPLVSLVLSRSIGGGGEFKVKLSEKQKKLLLVHGKDMFAFYYENVNESTNHLPPDNIQLSPVADIAFRTSPTNIGFYLVSLLAARDMEILNSKELYKRLNNSITVIEGLEKYKGNLYNWYDLKNLSVIGERYISSVDSGNFTVMLVALREGLKEYTEEEPMLLHLAERVDKLIKQTDLTIFFDEARMLFHIGMDKNQKPDNSFYDMLMSEARMTAYYTVACGKVPKKHWQALGRTLTHKNGYIGMMSWSGTAFEYLMPQLFLPLYRDSFMYESIAFALAVQRSEGDIWGVSESGFYSFDGEMHYQYKANGIQTLALRRVAENERVISPYSTYLSLCIYGSTAIKNLESLENRGMYGKYGLYEALDMNRSDGGLCVKSYMAHHIGMSIIAVMNAVFNGIFIRRFMADGSMGSARELLQEKIPTDAHVFDESGISYEEEKTRHSIQKTKTETSDIDHPKTVLLSRGDLSAAISGNGHIRLSCGERLISFAEFDKYSLRFTPGVTFTREGKHYGCVPLYGGDGYSFEQSGSGVSHIRSAKSFSGRVRYSMAKNAGCFVISTHAEALKRYDITLAFEPVLDAEKKFLSHISFSRLFIESEYDVQKRILYFHRRSRTDGKHIFTLAVAPRDRSDDFVFATDKNGIEYGSVNSPADFGDMAADNETGACVDPLCMVRIRNAEGGKATFLITCGATKRECERNIRQARGNGEEMPLPHNDEIAQNMLSAILYRKPQTTVENFSPCGIGDLWARGISGDHPLAVIYLSEIAVNRTDGILKAFLKMARAFIKCELIFVVSDGDGYNRPVEHSVRERCTLLGAGQYIGRNGGIFILREGELSPEFIAALKSSAAFYFDFCNSAPAHPQEEKRIIFEKRPNLNSSLDIPADSFTSGNGYFTKEGYTVDKSIPAASPYSFVLTGKRFSTVVTQSSLGYTFYDNARERRICSFYGDKSTLDNGERVFLTADGKNFDLCAISSKAVYEKGRAVYFGEAAGIPYTLTVTIPPKFPVKLIRIQLPKGFSAEMGFSISPVMGDSVAQSGGIEFMQHNASGNSFTVFRNTFGATFPEGYGFAGVCGGSTDESGSIFTANGNDIIFFLGACTTQQGAKNIASRINRHFFDAELSKAVDFAETLIPKISISTRSIAHDRMINFFLPYQVAACRFYARGSFYQSGGAYGFRDQLQDCLTLIYSQPHSVRTHIIRCCAHQYREGDVMHWWHTRHQNGVNSGIRSKCSDDLLYLPYLVADYIEKTGDEDLLDVKVHYIESPPLGKESERYEYPARSDVKESVYHHCLRALAQAEKRGRHGLILMGSCDWNDAFSLVGEKGIGESVFSTLLYIIAAERFIPIAEKRFDTETANHYRETISELRAAVEENAFFGDRYARAFCDDGTVLGIDGCGECEIDILSQAFAALAGLDRERTKTALNIAFSKLYDHKNRIFRLFSPPFANGNVRVGYIRGYVAGIRENGGQYTHGALWGALGFLATGMTEEALTVLECVNPASRCTAKELCNRYGIEPYAVAADIYSGQFGGKGGWSWYTGAASWYYRIMLEYVLGLKFGGGQTLLSASPVIAFQGDITLGNAKLHISSARENIAPTLDGVEVSFPLPLPDGDHKLELPVKE